jgi:hypothetical protein
VIVALSLTSFLSCAKEPPAPNLNGDAVSGCDVKYGTFVKVEITLNRVDARCRATVLPDKVCVIPGGAIRFKVVNECGDLIRPDQPALKITQPVPKREANEKPEKKPWTLRSCSGQFDSLSGKDDLKNVLFCEVPDGVAPGLYKYGLTGQIDPLDPDVEVRPPH